MSFVSSAVTPFDWMMNATDVNSMSPRVVSLSFLVTSSYSRLNACCSKNCSMYVAFVEARLRGLKKIAPWAEGNTRFVVNKLKNQNWKLYLNKKYIIFSSIVYKGYVVVTYQPCAHICNSCKRYVVVTYRSIICTSCKNHASNMCISGKLI